MKASAKMQVRITGMASYLPERVVTSEEVEHEVLARSSGIRFMPGTLKMATGIETRRHATCDMNTSDLAVGACRAVLAKTGTALEEIDLLIFAAASQDMVEPATAHI